MQRNERKSTPFKPPKTPTTPKMCSSPFSGKNESVVSLSEEWIIRRPSLRLKGSMKKSDFINLSKEEIIKILKQNEVNMINCQQDTIAWMELCKKVDLEYQLSTKLYLDSALKLKSFRQRAKQEKTELEETHDLHLTLLKERHNAKLLELNQQLESEREKFKQYNVQKEKERNEELLRLNQQLELEREQFRLEKEQVMTKTKEYWDQRQNEYNFLSNNYQTLESRFQNYTLETTRQLTNYEEKTQHLQNVINSLKIDQIHKDQTIESLKTEHSDHNQQLSKKILSLEKKLTQEHSNNQIHIKRAQESPLQKLETMTIRAQLLRSRNEELESRLSQVIHLEETNKALEKELINITKEKEFRIAKIKSDYEQKQILLEKELSSKLDQEKQTQEKLQRALTKLSDQLQEKESIKLSFESQSSNLNTTKQRNEEFAQELQKKQEYIKALESDLRLLHQHHQTELNQIDLKYRNSDYKRQYYKVIQEKKDIEKQFEKATEALKTLSNIKENLISNRDLTKLLENSTAKFKHNQESLHQQYIEKSNAEQIEKRELLILISRLFGINRAENIAREVLQERLNNELQIVSQ